ncbi:MAG: exopolyphosphatase [Hymenobacter sp.]|nr:MAG: exopolyphosphatase [Hymenobacter sp.]
MHAPVHHRRLALIDMGTNTFHLLIVEDRPGQPPHPLVRTKVGVRLGEGGISHGEIMPIPYARALQTLRGFKEEIELHQATEVRATATSAMRVSRNGPDLVRDILESTGIQVEVIGGEREAELIAKGIRQAVPLGPDKSLLMDIGGGSVEFIIANEDTIFWKHSFEIGAQRLLDQFFPPPSTSLAVSDFEHHFAQLLTLDHEQRKTLPGMFPMRADMLVVASIIVEYVLKTYNLTRITTSAFALKEGLLAELLGRG